jgi:MFS family permease
MLLSTLETTIVSTSLVSMVNELQGFSQAGWVVTAYFLTYTGEFSASSLLLLVLVKAGTAANRETRVCQGFLVIYAKLSDILGTKLLILFAVILFTVFSIACGVANTMLQLYG